MKKKALRSGNKSTAAGRGKKKAKSGAALKEQREQGSGGTTERKTIELPQVSSAEKRRAGALFDALLEHYPDAHCELTYRAPHELLIATILSAQTTDVGVNKATPALFARFPAPADYAGATPEEIEPYIKTLGFFRMKAKAVHGAMKILVEKHGGEVPRTMEELLELPGVARKTANVVLGNAFAINEGVVVDTHVQRVGRRLGFFEEGTNVANIEKRLMALLPRERWCMISHLLIWHGRRACKARGARCSEHPVCAKFGVGCENRGA
jgi:endonuclease III